MTHFNIYVFSSIVAILTCIILGWFVYSKGRNNKTNRFFAYFTLLVAFWCFFPLLTSIPESKRTVLLLGRITYLFGVYCPTVFLHFILVMLGLDNNKKERIVLTVAYSISTIFAFFTFNDIFIKGITRNAPFFAVMPGPLYNLYVVLFTVICLYGFCMTITVYKSSDQHKRNQLNYIFLAFIIAFISAQMHLLAPYIKKEIIPHDFLVIFYFSAIAYAIVRHQLMNIEVIIKKTLVFAGLFASVFAMVILPTLLIQEYIVRTASVGARMVGLTISGIIIILTMRRIETFLINITDKYLFQKKYDYKELLKTFTAEVLTVLELDRLVNLTVDKLSDIVKLNSCAVLLFDDEKQQFNVAASNNIKDPEVKLIRPDGIVTFMEETHGYILVKEMHDKKITIPASIQEIIDKLNAELIIPMVMHEEVIGVLSLGKKKSDEEYTQDDLDILLSLARTLAIAISNAQLFDELGKTQAEAAQKEKMAVIGTLSAGINHEICNPLGIARGQCEAFLLNIKDGLYQHKSVDELLSKAKEIMAKVIHETDRATAITKKLSGFAKPAKGECEIVDIGREVEDVLGLVGYELKLEKIEIEKHVEKGMPDIFVDKKQFQEVLFNLIRNAGQAIGEKGKITISVYRNKGKVAIDIKDTGEGIPEDKVNQLFNPFFTTKDPGKGTGLGLFIVRQVVEKNGGRIYLKETKVGEGTTFSLEFPPATVKEAKAKK